MTESYLMTAATLEHVQAVAFDLDGTLMRFHSGFDRRRPSHVRIPGFACFTHSNG